MFWSGVLFIYVAVSMIIGISFVDFYYKESVNPSSTFKSAIEDIETLGELLISVLLFLGWIFSIFFYGISKLIYNSYTIKVMNIKIKKH